MAAAGQTPGATSQKDSGALRSCCELKPTPFLPRRGSTAECPARGQMGAAQGRKHRVCSRFQRMTPACLPRRPPESCQHAARHAAQILPPGTVHGASSGPEKFSSVIFPRKHELCYFWRQSPSTQLFPGRVRTVQTQGTLRFNPP